MIDSQLTTDNDDFGTDFQIIKYWIIKMMWYGSADYGTLLVTGWQERLQWEDVLHFHAREVERHCGIIEMNGLVCCSKIPYGCRQETRYSRCNIKYVEELEPMVEPDVKQDLEY